LNNARPLGREQRLGCIEPGKLADIVLLTTNPLKNMRHARCMEFVLRDERICRSAETGADGMKWRSSPGRGCREKRRQG